jgi:hypothetical protein
MPASPNADPATGPQRATSGLVGYVVGLPAGKIVLWCYLAWYVVIATRYFDPAASIWLNAMGISAVIGTALWLGMRKPGSDIGPWPTFRLYLTPFCVSSFSSLIKGRGFVLVFPPDATTLVLAAGACAALVAAVVLVKGVVRARGA